jgi:hypothetical protein
MANELPTLTYQAVDENGVLVTIAKFQDSCSIENKGPDPVTLSFAGIPAAAGFANGQKELAVYETLNIPPQTAFYQVGFKCAATKSATVEMASKAGGAEYQSLKEWTGIRAWPAGPWNPGGGY